MNHKMIEKEIVLSFKLKIINQNIQSQASSFFIRKKDKKQPKKEDKFQAQELLKLQDNYGKI